MLTERKELIEAELRKATAKAAQVYLQSVINPTSDLVYELDHLQTRISQLEFDLKMIEELEKNT
jgi:hypothetical protein